METPPSHSPQRVKISHKSWGVTQKRKKEVTSMRVWFALESLGLRGEARRLCGVKNHSLPTCGWRLRDISTTLESRSHYDTPSSSNFCCCNAPPPLRASRQCFWEGAGSWGRRKVYERCYCQHKDDQQVKNSLELMLQNAAIACGAPIVAGNDILATLQKEALPVMSPFPETRREHQNV